MTGRLLVTAKGKERKRYIYFFGWSVLGCYTQDPRWGRGGCFVTCGLESMGSGNNGSWFPDQKSEPFSHPLEGGFLTHWTTRENSPGKNLGPFRSERKDNILSSPFCPTKCEQQGWEDSCWLLSLQTAVRFSIKLWWNKTRTMIHRLLPEPSLQ